MSDLSRIAALVGVLLVLAAPAAEAQRKKPKPVACPAARYLVAAPLVPDAALALDGIAVSDARQVSIDSGCPPVRAKVKATKKGTVVQAKWKTCGTLKAARLKGTIRDDCSHLVGTFKAKKRKAVRLDAVVSRCADARIDVAGGEACDDGNAVDCDGCRNDCARPDTVCGDGIVECAERCDPPQTDVCRDICQPVSCGDGQTGPGEECDDGNGVVDDGCDPNCTLPSCPNGFMNAGEECDDGDLDNLDGCRADCTLGTAPPYVRITNPAQGAIVGAAPVTVTGRVQDGITTLTVNGVAATIDGTTFTAAGVALVEGRNTLTAVATHQTGAVGNDAVSVTLDTTPPRLRIESPRDRSTLAAGTVTVAGLVSDVVPGVVNDADVSVTVNGVATTLVAGSFLASNVPLANGRNALVARAVDAAGNVRTAEVVVTRAAATAGQRITIVSGNEQSGQPGAALAPLVVRVTDALDTPLAGIAVRLRVTRGDGHFGNGVRETTLTTGANGQAQTPYRLGTRAGMGLHRVTVDAPGVVVGEAVFCETARAGAPAKVHVVSGDNQLAPAGSQVPAPFVAIVRDAASNPVAGAQVTFTRDAGTGSFAGATQVTATTNDDGRVSVGYTAGPGEGKEVIGARLAGAGTQGAFFEVQSVVPGPPENTTFAGVVVDNGNMPLPNSQVLVFGANPPVQTTTGADGRFLLTGVPPGGFVLEVVGPPNYPLLHFMAFAVSGRQSSLPEPAYLPKMDPAGTKTGGGPTDVDVDIAQVEGSRLRVFASSLRMHSGATTGPVSIIQVNRDKVPMPLPGGVAPQLVVSIQPPDGVFDPPAELILPNVEGLPPGFITELLSFDHDLQEYVSRGTMTVSEDGSVIRTDPGFGIIKGGWHGFAPPPPPRGTVTGNANDGNEPMPGDDDPGPDGNPPRPNNGEPGEESTDHSPGGGDGPGEGPVDETTHTGGDPVILRTGELVVDATDLRIPGRGLDFEMRRTYRSQLNLNGTLGWNWDFTYNEMLMVPSDPDGDIVRCGGQGRLDTYAKQPDGTYSAPRGLYDGLVANGDGTFTIRARNGYRRHFDAAGRLIALADRHGNQISIVRNGAGQIDRVVDTLGRSIFFTHNTQGRLVRVTDFIGRQIVYTYDDRGDLVAVRTPIVTGTSTGNDFPQGKTTRYEYSAGFDPTSDPRLGFLNHNLIAIRDAKNQRFLVNTYATNPNAYDFDRVIVQQEGTPGQNRTYAYTALNAEEDDPGPNLPRNQTVEVDRNGNRRVFVHNEAGNLLTQRVETNRNVNPDDPAEFVTTSEYNDDGELLRTTYPEGNSVEYEYDDANPDRGAQGNRIAETRLPGPRGGDQTQLRRTYSYEPIYNQLRSMTEPRGNDAGFVPPNGGANGAARYTTVSTFDYQEGTDLAGLAAETGLSVPDVTARLTAAGVALGLGDVNGDGDTDGLAGDVLRQTMPTVRLLPDSEQAVVEGGVFQPIVTTWTFNRFGQPVTTTDAAGNVDRSEYWPENDPDGDGIPTASALPLASDTGGYLRAIIRDADGPSPLQLRHEWGYDEVGNVVREVDGRGAASVIERNALNQTVRVTSRPPFNFTQRFFYDANGNVVREETQNVDTNGPGLGAFLVTTSTFDILDKVTELRRQISNTADRVTTYGYDANRNLTSVTKAEGNVEARVYDERDQVFRVTRGAGSPIASARTLTYDGNGNATRVVDAVDNSGDGQPERVRTTYDGFDRPIAVVDGLGNRTTTTYDPVGNVTGQQSFGPDGGASPVNDAGAGNVLLSQTATRHDEMSRPYQKDVLLFANLTPVGPEGSLTPGDGRVTSRTEYDRLDRATRLVDDNGHARRMEYDAADRLVREVDALGNEVLRTFDANDLVLTETVVERSPEGTVPDETFVTTHEYDALDRRIASTDSLGNRTLWRYDSRDNPILVRDPLGNTVVRVYDGLDRLISETRHLRTGGSGAGDVDTTNPANADGAITMTRTYDRNDRLVALTDDNGRTTTFTYDALDRKRSETFADGTSSSWTYDADDNVTTLTDAVGNVQTNTWDGLNRLVEKTVVPAAGVEGSTRWAFQYDGLSRVVLGTDENDAGDPGDDAVVEWRWDSLARLLVEVQGAFTVSSTVDGVGNGLALTYPSGRIVEQVRDGLDRPKIIRDQGSPTAIAEYDYLGPGRVLERRHGNGTRLRYHDGAGAQIGYDGGRRTVGIRHETSGGTPLAAFAYAFDRVGNRRTEVDLVADRADVHTYDSAYRLVRSALRAPASAAASIVNNLTTNADVDAVSGQTDATFRLDGLGNWAQRANDGVPVARTVNTVNAYATVGGAAQTYDANGNLRDDGTLRYAYDFSNRLVRVSQPNGTTIARFRYDVFGRRVRADVGATTTRFVHDGQRTIEERDGGGALLRQYVDGGGIDEHLELRIGAASYWYHQGSLGSIRALTDASGAVVERYRYDVYGEPTILAPNGATVRAASLFDNPYLFAGRHWTPAIGLFYNRARWLSPALGRFIHRDPRGYADGLNMYEYAGSNPVNLVDPMGTEKGEDGGGAGGGGKKPPCPPNDTTREIARDTLWALAYEENRIGGHGNFTAAYGAQDVTEHALFGDDSIMYANSTAGGSKPYESIMGNGGRFLPHREHQIFVPGYGEVDLRWLLQGYTTTDNPWGLEGFGGGVKAVGAELYSTQYTLPAADAHGSALGGLWGDLGAARLMHHIVKTDANSQINHMSFEMGRKLRSGELFQVKVGERPIMARGEIVGYEPIYKPGTLEDFARMSVGDPPTNDAYKDSSAYPPGWKPDLAPGAYKDWVKAGRPGEPPLSQRDCE